MLLISYLLTDDPQAFDNAPVGLQVMGRSQEEEAIIAMAEIIDNALKTKRQQSTQ